MLEDVVGGLRPDERMTKLVPAVDKQPDPTHEILDASKLASAGDVPEEHLHEGSATSPTSVRRKA
jgi:hypothetical protein